MNAQASTQKDRDSILKEIVDVGWRRFPLDILQEYCFGDSGCFATFDLRVRGLLATPLLAMSLADPEGREAALDWCMQGALFEAPQLERIFGHCPCGRRTDQKIPWSCCEQTSESLELLLLESSRRGNLRQVQILLESTDPNARDKDDMTPLHYASEHGHGEVAQLLLGKNAELDARDKDDWTPLH